LTRWSSPGFSEAMRYLGRYWLNLYESP
jgi:hypothetical protein